MSLGTSSLKSASVHRLRGARGARDARTTRYERLMQVTVTHTYYNASGNLCPDFSVVPTTETAEIMGSLGLLLRQEGSGFSVLLDLVQRDRFLSFLKPPSPSSPPSSPEDGGWRRLSFMMTVHNANFVNFTEMPICMTPAMGTFYLSNVTAAPSGNHSGVLNPQGMSGETILPVTGSQYLVTLSSPETQQVIARAISGAQATCEPVYWYANDTATPTCPGPVPGSGAVRRDPLYLNFSTLPEDKYEIEECATSGGDCASASTPAVVYAYSAATPMFFVDLLFAQPAGVSTGVYPVMWGTGGQPTIRGAFYSIELTHRSTFWNYYILSTGLPLTDLAIETVSSPTDKPVTFDGPKAVQLPNQQWASRFASNQPIPLQERSAAAFQLLGKVGGLEVKDDVLMKRLPVASSGQVIPGRSDFATTDPEIPIECRGFVQQGNNYSDIYVYV